MEHSGLPVAGRAHRSRRQPLHLPQMKAPQNNGNYCNAEVDKLLDQARTTSDPAERKAIYEKATKFILDDDPNFYLYHRRVLIAHTAKLEGYKQMPDGLVRVIGIEAEVIAARSASRRRPAAYRHAHLSRQAPAAADPDALLRIGDHLLAAAIAAGRPGADHGRRRARSRGDRADPPAIPARSADPGSILSTGSRACCPAISASRCGSRCRCSISSSQKLPVTIAARVDGDRHRAC